jgi:predicted transposase/invertase (TIGR01784 family)
MKQVASLGYEVFFKKAFCNVDIFKAFVKDILDIDLEITKVETEKSFQPPISRVATKFDLFAEDIKNKIIVNIQQIKNEDHYDRFLHYHCVALLEQAVSSHYYKPKMRVFTIVVLTSKDKHSADIAITDFAPKTLDGKCLPEIEHRIVYLNPKNVSEKTPDPYRQWLSVIADSLNEEVDETLYPNPIMQKLFDLIQRDDISPEERAKMFDEYNFQLLKFEAHQEGVKQGKLETAKAMLQKGIDISTITEITGLSVEEVSKL